MRYPLIAFLIVFVIPPYTAHALMSGKAKVESPAVRIQHTLTTTVPDPRSHAWTLPTSDPR